MQEYKVLSLVFRILIKSYLIHLCFYEILKIGFYFIEFYLRLLIKE